MCVCVDTSRQLPSCSQHSTTRSAQTLALPSSLNSCTECHTPVSHPQQCHTCCRCDTAASVTPAEVSNLQKCHTCCSVTPAEVSHFLSQSLFSFTYLLHELSVFSFVLCNVKTRVFSAVHQEMFVAGNADDLRFAICIF